jgi:hypothetical protein
LQRSNKFRIETHNIIIDTFCSELDKRIEIYKFVSDNFLFVTKLCIPFFGTIYENNDIKQSIDNFILTYKKDVMFT